MSGQNLPWNVQQLRELVDIYHVNNKQLTATYNELMSLLIVIIDMNDGEMIIPHRFLDEVETHKYHLKIQHIEEELVIKTEKESKGGSSAGEVSDGDVSTDGADGRPSGDSG